MASTSDLSTPAPTERTWADRVAGWHWSVPVGLAIALLTALVLAVVAIRVAISSALSGRPFEDLHAFVYSILCAYTLGAGLLSLASRTAALERLRPVLDVSASEFDALRRRLAPGGLAMGVAATLGGGVAVVLHFSSLASTRDVADVFATAPYRLPFMILLFGLLGVLALTTSRQSKLFREVGRSRVAIDLLGLGKLAPFARVGLRGAAEWLIGSALASFLTLGAANPLAVVGVILVTTGLGVVALVGPSTGLHERLREAKRAELARVREEIARERAQLLGHPSRAGGHAPPATEAGGWRGERMPALLAYEARIEAVREWPIDTATLRRFGLFLLIPLASWIGGALVERLVDAALG